MKTLLAIALFAGSYWVVSNLPSELAAALGLITLAGFFACAVVLGIKWVRNV